MFSPCSLETCGMLVPGGSFLGNREASQMRSHVGPCFFWKDGAALIFFGCFYVSKLLDNVGFCRHIWTKHKKKDMLPKLASKMVWLHQFQPSDQRPPTEHRGSSHFSGQPRCCCSVHPCFRLVYRLCSWKLVWFAESQIWALFKAVFPRAAWRDLV